MPTLRLFDREIGVYAVHVGARTRQRRHRDAIGDANCANLGGGEQCGFT